jgi:hypothetical protein
MTQPLTQFTYDGIPPLPSGPEAGLPPPPMTGFNQGSQRPSNGIPRFEIVARKQSDGSFKNVEFVTILTPGDPKASPRHKVTNTHRQIYARYYDLWRRGLEASPSGTPLEMYPVMTPALVHTLKALNIFTVEQLRDIPDSYDHQLPMARTMKNQAKKWLDGKKDADAISKQDAENASLKDQLKMMGATIEALAAKVDSQPTVPVVPHLELAPERVAKRKLVPGKLRE